MKQLALFLFFIVALIGASFGLKNLFEGSLFLSGKEEHQEVVQKKLSQPHPLLKDRKIVAIVYGANNVAQVERNLASLFNQTYSYYRIVYIDNGSTDGTFEKVREQATAQTQIEVIRSEQKKPILEILYPLIRGCEPDEIVALIEGKDWLAHENVFDHLNYAYANPDVWMTYSRSISHPDYQEIEGDVFPDLSFLEKQFRQKGKKGLPPLFTFYAGFFNKIKLQDLLYEGQFIDSIFPLALQLPLIEMGPEHVLFMNEVMYVKNREKEAVEDQWGLKKALAVESHLRSSAPYPTLSHFSSGSAHSPSHRYQADVILFSEDTPLHLYACLESLFEKVQDIHEVYVLYQGTDQEFHRAYLNLQNEFCTVHFFNVCEYPGNDFATLIGKALEKNRPSSPFVVFGTDQVLFEEKIFLHDAIDAMEKVHADYFFLSLEEKETSDLPETIPVNKGIYAFQLGAKRVNHPFVLSLFRKSFFEDLCAVENPFPSFKKLWQKKLTPVDVALFYEEKKTFIVNQACEFSPSQKKEWGYRFIEGFKIDLATLFCQVQELEKGTIPLIKRERRPPQPINCRKTE